MGKIRKDMLGNIIEVGDIILSAPLSSWGGVVGRVERISDTGRITIKYLLEVNVHAYEQGAPDKPYESTRAKQNPDGTYVYEEYRTHWGSTQKRIVYEKYEAFQKDYTVVGRKKVWVKGQGAEYHVLILKRGTGVSTSAFDEAIAIDYDAEAETQ